jgi:hypothetical protein
MQGRTLVITAVLSMMFIFISVGVNAQMGGPSDNSMGPGSGPGMDGNDPHGPRWEQQTEDKQLEKGLMFRYGKETPETSIESTDTGKDIGMKFLQLKFKNDTADLDIQVEDEEWELSEENTGDDIRIRYRSVAQWMNGAESSESTSEINIHFTYKKGEGERTLEYNVTVKDIPGKGNLSISLGLDTRNMVSGCCWSDDTPMQHNYGKTYTLKNEEGKELSQLVIDDTGFVEIGDQETELDSTVEETIVNSTAVMDVKMDLPLETRTASFVGSLSILDGLVDEFVEAAEFFIDHIYYFAGGAAVIAVIIIISVTLVSKKEVDTSGKELDLENNRYYRGPQ